MNKITILKKDEDVTYRRSESTVEFEVNGKKVRVYVHEDTDDQVGSDYDIDEQDRAKLTEEESEIFDDQGIWNLVKMKDGEKLEVDGWEE